MCNYERSTVDQYEDTDGIRFSVTTQAIFHTTVYLVCNRNNFFYSFRLYIITFAEMYRMSTYNLKLNKNFNANPPERMLFRMAFVCFMSAFLLGKVSPLDSWIYIELKALLLIATLLNFLRYNQIRFTS